MDEWPRLARKRAQQVGCVIIFWYNTGILQTFINLPTPVAESVSRILSRSDSRTLSSLAKQLHERYMQGENPLEPNIQSPSDCVAYLGLRFPATYAQISSALSQVAERIPSWKPASVLELGCGPGTGILAAKAVWPTISSSTGVDQEKLFLTLAEEIQYDAKMGIEGTWVKSSISTWMNTEDAKMYDLIIIANVLDELPDEERTAIVEKISARSSGVVVIIEPGTAVGNSIIQKAAGLVSSSQNIIAPYVDNVVVADAEHWIHFSQRFQRPEFQRRIRQSMRDSSLMASDWEDAKYAFVAWGSVPVETSVWGVCIGKIEKLKGFLTVPVLTKDGIIHARVLKRNKAEYTHAKNIRWGEILETPIQTS